MLARAARLRNWALSVSSSSAFGALSRFGSGRLRPPWRTQASGRVLGNRREKSIAHDGKKLRVLVAVGEVGRAAEQLLEGGKLHRNFRLDDFAVEPARQARAAASLAAAGTCRHRPA